MEVQEMLSVSSLIEFLMNLLRDPAVQAEFERDPQGVLAPAWSGPPVRSRCARRGSAGGRHQAVYVTHGGYHPSLSHGDDPVREISHITEHYEVNNVVVHDSDEYNFSYVDDRDTIVTVDDRDSTEINAEGDVTVTDSFNQDNDVNVIEDSFNEDNDGVDNKGGTIDDSVVAGEDIEDSFTSNDDTSVTDSYNDNSANVDASDDDGTDLDVRQSYNEDNDELTAISQGETLVG
jgi:hypothetical protein